MEFGLLGPLEVTHGDGPLSIGGPKQRTVLALLALNANRVVTVDRLIDALWGNEPPDTARNTLQTYVRHLRKALGGERIEHRSAGYVLRTEPSEVDLLRFDALVERARELAPSDPAGAAATFREATGLWRGPALDDLALQGALGPDIARLEESRLAAVEERIDAELAIGRHHQLVPELETLVRQHPYRERLWAHLMVALYRSGRQADALSAYQRARTILLDDLGVDPSQELRRLERQILDQDPALDLAGEPLRGYRVIERIGEGAVGVVSRALQPQVGREVAIKQIHQDLANDPEFVRWFEREARLVARLEHPRIVPLYDYWRDPSGAYLVMRYLRGGSLRDRIDARPIAIEETADVLEQVADALSLAHRQGVVHRDVRPENILLDEEGNAYLSDFGIATDLVEPSAAGRGATPSRAYASPEQLRGDPVTSATDVYALGVVTSEALGEVRGDLSPAVDRVLRRATAQDPQQRYEDPRALAAAFRDAIGSGAPAGGPAETALDNPYKGLHAFEEPDAADFFGRERAVARVLDRLDEEGPTARFLAVVGPSGSGKSSLIRAGLLPALRQGALTGSARWFVTDLVPGAHPFEELERAIQRVAIEPPAGLGDEIRRSEDGLTRAVADLLPADDGTELLVIVDQLEELFTLTPDPVERTAFLARLSHAVTDPRSRLRLVATLRADFYDAPLLDPRFGPLLAARTEAIAPLAPEELERAIAGPAERAGVSLEPSLLAEIVTDVADQPGALPLLQYALTELFEHRRGGTMTLQAYRRIGGVGGALATRAEDLYATLDDDGRHACRQLFLRLVSLEEGAEPTRRRVRRSELSSLEVDGRAMEEVIGALGRHRLLAFDRDAATREPTVEVAHEALLTAWERLRGWIEEGREDVVLHRRLAASADEWSAADRDPSFLLSGARLERIAAWADEAGVALARPEREFVRESVERHESAIAAERARLTHERALERRSIRRLRALVAALSAAALLAATLTVIAVDRSASAERQRDAALIAGLTGDSLTFLERDPELSVLLALHAVGLSASIDEPVPAGTVEALHWAMQEANIEYPVVDGPTAVVAGPLGTRGVFDLPVPVLADHARAQVARTLTPEQCVRFLGFRPCPPLPDAFPASLTAEPISSIHPTGPSAAAPLAGTNVDVLWGGHQDDTLLEPFRKELEELEERTGIEITFVDFPEIQTWLTEEDAQGDPPDAAFLNPGSAADLARADRLIDLGAFLDAGTLEREQSPYLVSLGTMAPDGSSPAEEGDLFGTFVDLSVKSLVWYPAPELRDAGHELPRTLSELTGLADRLRTEGRTPWCFGFESGEASGWPGTDWIENFLLAEAGPETYDRWTSHDLPFDSEPVRAAFRGLGDIAFPPGAILGGASGALRTSFADAPQPLIEDPPGCWLHLQATFLAEFLPPSAPGTETDVFPFPPAEGDAPALIGGGDLVTAFSDRPEVRELVRFLISPRHGRLFARRGTGFMSPNRSFDLGLHTPFLRPPAEALRDALEADTFRFDGSDLMPPEVGAGAFWRAMVTYFEEGPSSLDGLLSEIDAAWPDDG